MPDIWYPIVAVYIISLLIMINVFVKLAIY